MFLEGQIIEFLDNDQLKVGYVRKQEHDRLQIVDPRGRHVSISGDRVVVIHRKSSEDGFPSIAKELTEKVQNRQDEVDVELLWESLSGTQREFTSTELASLFFSDSSPDAVSAVFRSLSADTLFFRRKGLQFLPRTVDQVGTERTRREREQENERTRGAITDSLHRLLKQRDWENTPETEALLDRLQRWMRHPGGDSIGSHLEEITGVGRARDAAYDILSRAGRFAPSRDRFLTMAGVPEEFPVTVLQATDALVPFQHQSNRVDHRETFSFTIDDDDTLEVDDAISVRRDNETITVGIHIADVSHFVEKGDPLDLEAAGRSSTIYLPAETVRMFPEPLSTGLASLQKGDDRPTFSVEVQFDSQFNRLGYRIAIGTIRVQRRLSYELANELIMNTDESLPGSSDLKLLHAIACKLQQERAARGAITIRRPEIQVHVDACGIHVSKLDSNTPSRLLVSEFMILCNSLSADFAALQNLPIIYRTQEPRDSKESIDSSGLDPLAFEKLRKTFKRSRLSLTPGIHSGLGLSAYTQISSPIRRYADLVTQRQFTSFLESKPLPYDRDELLRILANAETYEQTIRSIEDQSTTYWILKYLADEKLEQLLPAVVMDRKGTIELADYYLRGKLPDPGSESPGSALNVKIDFIRPEKNEVRFRRA